MLAICRVPTTLILIVISVTILNEALVLLYKLFPRAYFSDCTTLLSFLSLLNAQLSQKLLLLLHCPLLLSPSFSGLREIAGIAIAFVSCLLFSC